MAERGWATLGRSPLLYGLSVPGGVVCKCEHTSKWESGRDNSYQRGGKFTRLANVYSPWLQRVCGAGETPLKCKAAPLPWRAGHGQPQPRKRASKAAVAAGASAGSPLPSQSWGPTLHNARNQPRDPHPRGRGRDEEYRTSGRACQCCRPFPSLGKAMGGQCREVPIHGAQPHSPGQSQAGGEQSLGPLSLNLAPSV